MSIRKLSAEEIARRENDPRRLEAIEALLRAYCRVLDTECTIFETSRAAVVGVLVPIVLRLLVETSVWWDVDPEFSVDGLVADAMRAWSTPDEQE